MGTLGAAAGSECFQSGAVGSAFVGFEKLSALKPMQLHLRGSEFVGPSSLRRRSSFLRSSTDREILAGGRLRYGPGARHSSTRLLRTGGDVSRSTIVGQVHQDSETNNFQERHFPGESSSRNCRNGDATENSFDGGESSRMVEQGLDSENRGTNSRIDSHHHSDGATFRIGRRMLLGAVSVGLSAVYSSSSEGARAADKGFKFSLTKGSWFLGDSEADVASEEEKTSEGEKKDSGPQEKESRVYDATVLGEPVVIGSDSKERVWTRLFENRVIYLGEAETVADSDDKLLELEIVQTLRDRCFQQQRGVALAFQAFPCPLQPQLNAYMSHKLTEEQLRAVLPLSEDAWLEYLPILQYCKDNGVRLIACGAPETVLRTVQAEGVQALSKDDKRKYIPPAGGGYKFKSSPLDNSGFLDSIPDKSGVFGPGPYRFAQARVVEDYTMTQVVSQVIAEGGAVGLLVVITGASHVQYGARGTGLPAWISKNKDMQKRTQAVVLLNPERQYIRNEGDLPVADFLWYSAAKVCTRNCFDRAEVARVMGAAGRRRDALPKDLQIGLKQGLVAPTVLQNFFELEQNPIMAELTGRFQGLRERWFADPRFLERLFIEETISITTTVIAQYERRGARFWQEIDYVATDTIRGAVVDFFTVWLPAPRLSFREINPNDTFNALDSLKGLLGSFPDNAFQRPQGGESWGLGERVGGILVGGLKLFAVGLVSSIGTLAGTNFVLKARQLISPEASGPSQNKRSPILKTAVVYGSFLATSANLRYQVIAGVVEHWVADYWLASQPLAGNALSFVARTANSYFGTSQWIDLARFTGLQAHGDEADSSSPKPTSAGESAVERNSEPVSSTSAVERISEAVSSTSAVERISEAISSTSAVERISEAVSSTSAVERISEAVSSTSAVERISEAVSSTSAVERISEAVSSTPVIDFLGKLSDLQTRSDETDSSSNSTSTGELDVERNSDTVVTSSSVAEDHSSSNNGSKTTDGSKNGSLGPVQEKVEVPKS